MASTIIIKNKNTGAPSSLAAGELAINTTEGSLYYGSTGGTSVSSSFKFGALTSSTFTNTGDAVMGGSVEATVYNSTTSTTGYKLNGVKFLWRDGGADLQVGNDSYKTDIIGTNIDLQSPVTASIISASAGFTGSNAFFDGNITSSGNISASGDLTGKIGYFSDDNGIYTDKIRRFSDSATTTLIKLNDEHIKIFAGSNTAEAIGVQNQAVKISGSLNVESPTGGHITASGNISSSGTIEASGYKGTPIVLARQSQYIGTTVANNYYYGNNTQGFFHHTVSGKVTSTPVGSSMGQGVQHNSIILPCNVKDIELRASCRTNTTNAGFAFWVCKNERANHNGANVALTFLASGSVADVGSEHLEFWKCDIIDNHAFKSNMTASVDEALWVFFQPYDAMSTAKIYWTLSARTNE